MKTIMFHEAGGAGVLKVEDVDGPPDGTQSSFGAHPGYRLEQAAEAYRRMENRQTIGKILLTVT